MSLNGIVQTALSALQTNSSALNVVSNNIANINTQGYAQRQVNEQAMTAGGQLEGVDVADVQRVVNQFLQQEALYAGAASSQYSAQTNVYSQLDASLGQPSDDTSLTSQLDALSTALGSATLSPNSSASQQSVLTAFQNTASTISSLSGQISTLQGQVDQQISTSVGSVNQLITQIYSLNQQIQTAAATGDTSSGLLDQRDLAIQNLSQMIGVRVSPQANGTLNVSTQDGVNLVGSTYAQLSYSGGSTNGTYGPITLQNIDPVTQQTVGPSMVLDPHLGSGSIEGLVQMRDGQLANFQQELGQFAQQTAQAYNAQSNANSAFPPPQTLNGQDTGLLATDSLNFTGQTTVAVTDQSGNLVSRVDVDFDNDTISVDGGAPAGFTGTVGGFTTALNAALGTNGTASFANGQLSISGSSGNGIVVQDNAGDPTSRGGTAFSQFFGLNDVFTTTAPSNPATGLSASDAGNFADGGTMSFVLKGPDGQVGKQASVTVNSGMTIGDIVTSLNTAFGGAATFTLGSNGALTMTPSASNAGYALNVTGDSTVRGDTGMSFTTLFGLGEQQAAALTSGFAVNQAMVNNPADLPVAQADISSATVAGDQIVGSGDSSGLLALQSVNTNNQTFSAAGNLAAGTMSLDDYAGNFYQDIATQGAAAQSNSTTQSDRLTEAQTQMSQVSGVNLDQQLSDMVTYQQAYSAGARILQTAQALYDTLLQIPSN
ncbi:MAG: flagellar hook-associated protein FlgK [Rhizomicrobium sp.]